MYHFVRDLSSSRFPKIKGLDLELFKEQINYLTKNYNIIKMEDVIDSIDNNCKLPSKAALLTFDDGYSDHFKYAFPILKSKNIQGSFFAPAKAITQNKVLDVNKIHFILASIEDVNALVKELLLHLDTFRKEFNLKSNDYYLEKHAHPNRFDLKEVIFIKRMLQVELEEKLRNIITDLLFKKYVTDNESSFSDELYMNIDSLKIMHEEGMHIGSHGFDHYWLGSLSLEDQELEILNSIRFLEKIGIDLKNWTMCYPYGSYNNDTIELLQKHNCKLALTSVAEVATPNTNNRFELPRLDTNDIPKSMNSIVNRWYLEG